MFVHIEWGRKVTQRKEGRTAHFCPVCRNLCEATLIHLNNTFHVNQITMGRGTHVGSEVRCRECRSLFPARKDLGEHDMGSVEFTPRVQLEERMLLGQVSARERNALLKEAICAMDYDFEHEIRRGRFRSVNSLLIVSAIFLLIVSFTLCCLYFSESNPSARATLLPWTAGFTCAAIVIIPWAVYREACAKRILLRRRVLPRVARAVEPLDPSAEEIDAICALSHGSWRVKMPDAAERITSALDHLRGISRA